MLDTDADGPSNEERLSLRERRWRRTREDILAAAWELAERDGIAALSLRDLAAEVGMRAPSLYTYFDGKDAIYDAMFAQGYEQMTSHMNVAEDVGGSAREAIVHAMERWLAFCQASVARYQLLFTRVIPGWEPSPEAYATSQTSYAQMRDALASYGIEGQRPLDLFTAVTAGLASQQLANDPTGDRWVRLAPTAADMLLAHLDDLESDDDLDKETDR